MPVWPIRCHHVGMTELLSATYQHLVPVSRDLHRAVMACDATVDPDSAAVSSPRRICKSTIACGRPCLEIQPFEAGVQVRPPVEHIFGSGPLAPSEKPAPVSVFRHRLLQHFMLSVFCKLPIKRMTCMRDIRCAGFGLLTPAGELECSNLTSATLETDTRRSFSAEAYHQHDGQLICIPSTAHSCNKLQQSQPCGQ